MKKIFLLFLVSSILYGCAQVPSEVNEEINAYHDTDRKKAEDYSFEQIDISDILENAQSAIDKDYVQFDFSDNISLDFADEVYQLSFNEIGGFSSQFVGAMEMFFDKKVIEKQVLNEYNDGKYEYTLFENKEDKLYGCVNDKGFIAILKPEVFDISYSYNEEKIKIYHLDRNEDLSDEYELEDGKCSIEEAANYVNKWLKDNYSNYSSDFDYKVETIIVRKHGNKFIYQVLVNALYKNVPIDSYTKKTEKKDNKNTGKILNTNCCIQIQMVKSNDISSFTNLSGIYEPKEVKKIDKCISLESALNFCENFFSDFKNITISDIDIMYTINPVYEEKESDAPVIIGYNSRPVWELVIDVSPSEFLKDNEIDTYGDIRKYIYIDIETGELTYNFDITLRR